MKMRLEFDHYNGTEQFLITRFDVEYLRAMSGWARDNPDKFKLTLSSGGEVNTLTLPIGDIGKVNTLASKTSGFDDINTITLIAYTKHKPPQSVDELLQTADTLCDIIWFPFDSKKELGEHLLDGGLIDAPDCFL